MGSSKEERKGGDQVIANNHGVEPNPNSYSLDPKLSVWRSMAVFKGRLINYLNKTSDSQFGSCNEFTLGITKTPEKQQQPQYHQETINNA